MKLFSIKMPLGVMMFFCMLGLAHAAQQEVLSQGVSVNTGAGEFLTTTFTTAGVYNITVKCPAGGVKVLYVVIADDADVDGMSDTWEWKQFGTVDVDGTGDFDQDGLTDLKEFQNKTDPKKADTDNDGMPDSWEVLYGLNPLSNDATGNPDLDGFKNLVEYQYGLNPRKAESSIGDEDKDGYPNIYEVMHGTRCDSAASIPSPSIIVTHGISTIQQAIDSASQNYAIIKISAGTYTGAGNTDLDFRGKLIMLVGDLPETTIIDCETSSRGFNFHSNEGSNSTLSRVTIRNANADNGGGIFCRQSSPTILNCVFSGNTAINGAGIYSLGSRPVIRNCSFIFNKATENGGAIYSYADFYIHRWTGGREGAGTAVFRSIGSSPLVDGCTFNGNHAALNGAALFLRDIQPQARNLVTVEKYVRGSPVISKCRILNNTSDSSSAVYMDNYVLVSMVNCMVTGNKCPGIVNALGCLSVMNCTVSGNTSYHSNNGAGVQAIHASTDPYPGYTTLMNTIVWGNLPAENQIYAPVNNTLCKVDYSCHNGLYPVNPITGLKYNYLYLGSHNITSDPLLTADGHVEKNSPTKNKGILNGAPTDDIDGDARTGGVVYIGADQYVDSDGDELPDWWEKSYGLNPLVPDGNSDTDNDGLSNAQEYSYSTNPLRGDTDNDGLPDKWEVENNFEPLVPTDAGEDTDNDGLTNLQEYQFGTNPRNSDSDGDGWTDGDEVGFGSDPAQENLFVDCEGKPEGQVVPASKRITIPQGVQAVFVKVVVFSREYPEYTGSGSEFNDVVTYGINSPAENFSGSYNVNSLHTQFTAAGAYGGTATVKEVVLDYSTLTQTDSSYLDLSATSVNVSDDQLGSGVVISINSIKVDFVRLWDSHQEANRTTRAIDSELRTLKTYEDNERSDSDLLHDVPMLVLGGWGNDMSTADVKLQCQFQPATAGSRILWRVDTLCAGAGVNGNASGDFSAGDTISLNLMPSTLENRNHSGKDFVVKIGIDQNGDHILDSTEEYPLEWGIRVIGKSEYDYCRASLPAWQITLGSLLYPDTMDFLDIFLDSDLIPSYQANDADTLLFSDGSYEQKDGLGCDPTSLTQGNVRRYTWQKPSGLRERVLLSDDIWNQAIQATIAAMNIGEWYADPAHAGANYKTFSSTFSAVVSFASTENLANALGKAYVNIVVTLMTERATPKAKIYAMQATGTVTDLYDFQTQGGDQPNGYAGRIQTCYAPSCGRTAGKVFKELINCDVSNFNLITPVEYDDYNGLKGEWIYSVVSGW